MKGYRPRRVPPRHFTTRLYARVHALTHERIDMVIVQDSRYGAAREAILCSAAAYEQLRQDVPSTTELPPVLLGRSIVVSPFLPYWRKKQRPSRERYLERKRKEAEELRRAEEERRAKELTDQIYRQIYSFMTSQFGGRNP